MRFLVVCLLGLGFGVPALGAVTVPVPPQHYILDLYERLEADECFQPYIRTVHPQAFGGLKKAIFMESGFECKAPPELIEETKYLAKPTLPPGVEVMPLLLQNDEIRLPGLDALITPVYPLREGRPYFSGANVFTEIDFSGAGGQGIGLAYGIRPGMVLASQDYANALARFYLQEGWISVGYQRFELTYGKLGMYFGDTRHGSLIFSQAMRPMTVVRLRYHPKVGVGGGGFSTLAADTWIGSLGESSGIQNARLWATTLAWRPSKWFEMALLQAFQLGGDGLPTVGAGDYLRMFFHADDGSLFQKRKAYWAAHFNLWGPSHFAKFYWQVFGDTDAGTNGASHIFGVWVPKLSSADFRVEVAVTAPGAYDDPIWSQGLTHEGSPIGHPLGQDALGFYADLRFGKISGWQPTLNFTYEERGRTTVALTEQRVGGGIDAIKRWPRTTLEVSTRFLTATNHNFLALDQDIFGIHATFRYSLF